MTLKQSFVVRQIVQICAVFFIIERLTSSINLFAIATFRVKSKNSEKKKIFSGRTITERINTCSPDMCIHKCVHQCASCQLILYASELAQPICCKIIQFHKHNAFFFGFFWPFFYFFLRKKIYIQKYIHIWFVYALLRKNN
uniref:Hypothetical secreted protein n=1 Tax=Simulium nigrimanum TaxID=683695 RepID=D1FQ12_SIMNI